MIKVTMKKAKTIQMKVVIKNQIIPALLSRLDIDSLKIQEETEEVVTILSGSENNSISNIKLTKPMHTALIFKEQVIVKDEYRIKREGLSPTSLLNTTY
jgi:hypothetical protein